MEVYLKNIRLSGELNSKKSTGTPIHLHTESASLIMNFKQESDNQRFNKALFII